MEVDIRGASEADGEQILSYYTDLLSEHFPYIRDNPIPTLEKELEFIRKHDGKSSVLLCAQFEGKVVGLSGYRIANHHQYAHVCSMGISVSRPFRNRGIGRKLIDAGIAWCRSKAVRRLELEVVDGNPAVAFYRRLGFAIEGTKRFAIKVGDEFKDMLIMAKLLD